MQVLDAKALLEANNDMLRQQRQIVSREEMKPLTKRSDTAGLLYISVHFAAIAGSGVLLYPTVGSYWMWPAMFLHGVLLNHLFGPVHECAHGTAFRTRWLNDAILWLCGLITFWPPFYFRYDHTGHHTFAQVKGRDPEQLFPPPYTLFRYIYILLGFSVWARTAKWLFNHSMGRMAPFNRQFVPDSELHLVYWEARIMTAIYVSVIAVSLWFGSWNAVIYWFGPVFLATPVARAFRIADHAGCALEMNLHNVARTVKTDPITQFLCWNMNFHCEHHLAPSVPFHALPALHAKVGHKMNPTDKGYFAVHWEILTRHVSGFFRRKDEVSDASLSRI